MKLKRTILGPSLVAVVAIVSGGWLLQQGDSGGGRALRQARVFDEVLQRLSTDYVDPHASDELYQMATEGMLRELGDPHTVLMSPDDYNNLRSQTTGEYGGLGVQIAEKDGWVTVIAPLPGTPAERAGLLAGDRIIEVEGKSTAGWTDDDAVRVLRGPKGEAVNIKIGRPGVDEPIPYRIVRDEITVKSVPAAYMIGDGVGYARLTMFAETSTSELRAAIDRLRREGMKGLILDLRMNPGGLLDQGISVSDLFVGRGDAVVETRARDPRESQIFRARTGTRYPDMPVVVLVDEYSASAAEIVAGALQDHDRALVVGTRTFGKGSVQSLLPVSGGYFLKMTTGKWYTPVGRSIQKDRQRKGDLTALVEEQPIDEDLEKVVDSDTAARKPYRTDSGRIVYGGGGIVPDIEIRPDTLTAAEKEFFEVVSKGGSKFSDVLFRYSIDYARRNTGLQRDFAVTAAMRDEIFGRLRSAGLDVSRDQFQRAQRLIDQRVAYEISLHEFGQAAATERANSGDNVVRAAVELLRSAPDQQALFRAAEARRQALHR